jgi:hypothetical protein
MILQEGSVIKKSLDDWEIGAQSGDGDQDQSATKLGKESFVPVFDLPCVSFYQVKGKYPQIHGWTDTPESPVSSAAQIISENIFEVLDRMMALGSLGKPGMQGCLIND